MEGQLLEDDGEHVGGRDLAHGQPRVLQLGLKGGPALGDILLLALLFEPLADLAAGLAGFGDLHPVPAGAVGGFGGIDLHHVAVAELVVKAHHPPVDLGPHHGVAHGGVDGIGEIDRGGLRRQVDDVAPGGKDEHLVGEHVDLQGVDELLRVRVLLVLQQAADPLVGLLPRLALDALLVLPVGRHAVLRDGVHVVGPDLHLKGDARLADDGGVQALVHVGLGRGDIVLEPAQDGLVEVVDHAQHVVAVRHRVHQDPEGEEVIDLVHGLILGVHFAVDAVGVLHPAIDRGVGDAHLAQPLGDLGLDHAHELLVLLALCLQLGDDLVVGHRIQIFQGQVLQLPLDLLHTQAVGEGGVDLHGLEGFFLLLLRRLVLHGAHVVQPVGDLDEDDTDILAHGKEHLPEVLHLLLLHGAVCHPGQLGNAVHDVRHRGAEALGDVLVGAVGVLDAVVEQGGYDRLAVQAHLRHDLGHLQGVGDIGGAVPAQLGAVVLPGIFIGGPDLREIGGDVVSADRFFQMLVSLLYRNHVQRPPFSSFPKMRRRRSM